MSQVQEHEYVTAPDYTPVAQPNHMPLGEALASAASAAAGAAAMCIQAAMREIPTAKFGDLMAADGRTATPFQVHSKVDELLQAMRTAAPADVQAVKAKALGVIASLPIACARNGQVAALATQFAAAESPKAAFTSLQAFTNAVKAEHRTGYTAGMTACIEKAIDAVGMRVVGTSTQGSDIEVRASDGQGRGLRTALLFDAAGKMSMRTKLTGFHDGSCHQVMERYYAGLRAQDVTFSGESRHWRNGACLITPAEEQEQRPVVQQNKQRQ